jgi:hypothetical protein
MNGLNLRELLGAGMSLMLLLICILWIETAPTAGEPIAVVTNPWGSSSALQVAAAAHGLILRAGRWSWIAVTTNDDDPSFQNHLRAAGAWLLLSPIGLGTCLESQPPRPQPSAIGTVAESSVGSLPRSGPSY